MQKITPFLWFDNQLEDAIQFYTSIFRNSRVTDVKKGPDGKAFTASFELEGQAFMGLNGGPHFIVFRSRLVLRALCRSGGGRLLLGAACSTAARRSTAAG